MVFKEISNYFGVDCIHVGSEPIAFEDRIIVRAWASCNDQQKEVVGFGADSDSDRALDKAISELVERLESRRCKAYSFNRPLISLIVAPLRAITLFKEYNPLGRTTAGTAVHLTRALSQKVARRELIEKHALLSAQILGVRGKVCRQESLTFSEQRIDLTYFVWECLGHFVSLCELRSQDFHTIYASGCSDSVEGALEKSKLEAAVMVTNFRSPPILGAENRLENPLRAFKTFHYSRFKPDLEKLFYLAGDLQEQEVPKIVLTQQFLYSTYRLPMGLWFTKAINPYCQLLPASDWSLEQIHPDLRFAGIPNEPPYAY